MTMAASKAIGLAALCVILATLSSAYYSMEDMCANWSGSGYIGNPSDCAGWGYCKNQKYIGGGKCDAGLVYDPPSSSCQKSTDVPCFNNIKQTCSVYTGFMEDTSSCQKYAYCFPNGTDASLTCPPGQTYSTSGTCCVWGPTCEQNNLCRFMPNNIFVGDPVNCGNYMQCLNGFGQSKACPLRNGATMYYNAAAGVCQPTNPCTDATPSTPGTNPTVKCTDLTAAPGYLADPDTCYGYYYCAATTSDPKWGVCPPGLQFDVTAKNCVLPLSVSCSVDRCANTNMTFATVPGTDCKMYKYCGSATATPGNCPSTTPYFDERQQACVTTLAVEYPICVSSTARK